MIEVFFFLSSGFFAFNCWIKKLNSIRVNLLRKLCSELDVSFDYDVWSKNLKQTMRHISLISVCLHFFFHCYRRCDKLPRSQYLFFCSQIRSRDFGKTLYFLDIVIDERDFQEGFCDMVTSTIDLDISLERPVYLSDYNIRFDSRCDYYQKLYKPGELLVCFTSILVRE